MRAIAANAHRVAVVVYDRLSLFEFSVACEVFGADQTRDFGVPWYRLAVCGATPTVRTDGGLTLSVPRRLASVATADTVVVPPCDDPGAVPEEVLRALRRAHARGARMISLCTGAFVLARAGVLAGRRAVTHWENCADFRAAFPSVTVDPSVLYVDDGDVLTSAGSAASIDLCLHVVRLDHGAEVATRLARQLVVPPHRDGGQAQFIDAPMPAAADGDPLADTLAWMVENLDRPLSVPEIAARAAMSPRSFARHFHAATGATPYQWLLHQRVALAERLLERGDLPVETVAQRAGLGDAVTLRRHFRRRLGTSPQAYRRAFGARSA